MRTQKSKSCFVFFMSVLVILIIAHPSLALNTDNVLRVYLDPGLSAMTLTTDAVPDTITAYLVLENPTVTGNLTQCGFVFRSLRSTLLDITSPYGLVTNPSNNYFELLVDSPFPLEGTTQLAEIHLIVDSPEVDNIDLYGGSYDLSTWGTIDTNKPFRFNACAWINPGTPSLSTGPPLVFAPQGTNRAERLYTSLKNSGDGPAFLSPSFGPGCEAFSLLNPGDLDVIPPHYTIPTEIQFAPQIPGEYQCQFSFSPGIAVSLQGTGRTPIYAMSGPASVDFGAVAIGGIGYELIEVVNEGDYDLVIDPSQTVPCDYFSHYFPDNNRTIVPNQLLTITMSYAPQDSVLRNCNATFGDSLLVVNMAGSGYVGTMAAHALPDTGMASIGTDGQTSILINLYNDGDVYIFPDFDLIDPDGVFTVTDSLPSSVEPAKIAQYRVTFAPHEARTYYGELLMGPGLPTVPLVGRGLLPYPAIDFSPAPLVFPPTNPGEESTATIHVENTGNSNWQISPSTASPLVTNLGPATSLSPGSSVDVSVTYRPITYGQFSFQVVLSSDPLVIADCIGPPRFDFAEGQNQAGIFFDTGFSIVEQTITTEPQVVTAYLALANASDSSGIDGWECRIEPSEGAALVGVTLAGDLVDADPDVHDFSVGYGSAPLPPGSAVLLSTLQVLVWDMTVEDVAISLLPHSTPTIPGLMAWTPGTEGSDPVPMVITAGTTEVAWIHLRDGMSGTADRDLPPATRLLNNVPNPFNPQTEIRFELAEASPVRIVIYDLTGRRVKVLTEDAWPAGLNSQIWDGRDGQGRRVPSGAYYVRMVAGNTVFRQKVMLVK